QTNFSGILTINGAPVGKELDQYYLRDELETDQEGSCMIVVATNAPLLARQLERLARRAVYGLVRAGGITTHGSGDYVIAFSTAKEVRYLYQSEQSTYRPEMLRDDQLSPLFLAVTEAAEEAIYHSLFAAEDMQGYRGNIKALPEGKVKSVLKKYNMYELR
ncbi:MAG: S58 family peptidase, partial [Aliifodinibius sp.]|nr:S58 family peptidase [Fodinibius sp.]